MKKIVIIAVVIIGCNSKRVELNKEKQKYIDSVIALPHLERTIKAHKQKRIALEKQINKEKEQRSRELNRVIIRNK